MYKYDTILILSEMYNRRSTRTPSRGTYRNRVYRPPRRFVRNVSTSNVRNIITNMAEKKYYDFSWENNAFSYNTPVFSAISDVPPGLTDTTRVGDKLTVNSFELKMLFSTIPYDRGNNLLRYRQPIQIRVILFKWYDDSNPTVAQIISGGTTSMTTSPLTHDFKSKRKILMDEVYTGTNSAIPYYVPGTGAPPGMFEDGSFYVSVTKFIDCKKMGARVRTVNYINEDITGVGKFFTLFVSNQNDSNTAIRGPTVLGSCRMNYVDI